LRTLNELYEDFGLIDDDHAPYKDVETAEYERKLNELREEVSDYQDEIKSLEKANKELRDSVNNNDKTADEGTTESISSGGEDKGTELGEFEATFYAAFCPTGCTGITATGIDVSNTIYHAGKRIIAVDPNVIPLGSHVKITLADGSSFEATAQDTGGDIKGSRIDILVGTRDEAYALGRQAVKVEVIK